MQTIIQNHCTLKVTKSKTKYETILGSNIYAKLLSLHALTGCDTTFSIKGVGKSLVFEKPISNKQMQEAALVFTTSSKLHEEIETAGKKTMSIVFKGDTDHSLDSLRHKQLI